ncbi:DEAD-box ATP-dependent RNA helicase 20-like [Pyrus ussuriensis x Pyrus communis]|uniref:DEAD-box ATP-dependent RNA helicase 20-like n=1 Tax=Pyrus ussuriensis x Pyrus communis TaxID=2448454 RepID=A0A5N5GSA6_9ROSA|nr:DEAD-box ATP-dependent RNA helicase 20-like [Pyrus ussuriensis x Pyrus communis]
MLHNNFQKLDLLGLHQFKLKYGQWLWRAVTSLLAYLMPAIVHINSQPKLSRGGDGPRVLILAPTERLGEEIQQEYAKFCAASNIKVLLSWKLSSPKKSRGGILIATPRTLHFALEDGYTNVRRVTYLVLDGADWMLEKQNMGFGSQIQDIVSKVRDIVLTLFC